MRRDEQVSVSLAPITFYFLFFCPYLFRFHLLGLTRHFPNYHFLHTNGFLTDTR